MFGLPARQLPHFTTVCHRKQQGKTDVWRVLLRLSVPPELGDVQAIDASAFDPRAVSRHYRNRVGYYFQAVKPTIFVDCEIGVIIYVHCSLKQPHGTHIGLQVLTRNLYQLSTITADKGDDWDDLRAKLRDHGVRLVIKHKEVWQLDKAHNARTDDDIYHLGSNVESTFFALKHRYGDRLRARNWSGQFRELVLKAAVRNIERVVKG